MHTTSPLKKLIISLLLFTVAVVLILALLTYGFEVPYLHQALWYIVLFVFVLTALSLLVSQRGAQKSQEAVVKYVMGGTVIRFTLSILAIYIALKTGIPDRVTFVVNFMIMYFVFLAFELYSLLTTLRPNFEKPT